MSAFLAVSDRAGPGWRDYAERLRAQLLRQGMIEQFRRSRDRYELAVFESRHEACAGSRRSRERDDGALIACAGTLIRGHLVNAAAIERLEDLSVTNGAFGNFCGIVADDQSLSCRVDELGLYHVYLALGGAVVCSSFLALAASLERRTPNNQCVYEYIIQGATYGNATVLEEIELLDPCETLEIVSGSIVRREQRHSAVPTRDDDDGLLRQIVGVLRSRFRGIANAGFGGVDMAISGGYDSRLMLALAMNEGITPRLHVYGAPDSPDVRIARRVAAAAGLELSHLDKSRLSDGVGDPIEMAAANYQALDGLPIDGIYNSGADVVTRSSRAEGGAIALNGGGGEIYRNFYYLPDTRFTVDDIVRIFYHQFAPGAFSDRFDDRSYLDALAGKLSRCFPDERRRLTRPDVEWLYPYFRCRYWMGRNNSLNNRFGPSLTPLVDFDLAQLALGIPLALKNSGVFEARMIHALSPDLAAVESEYGHSFSERPPIAVRATGWLQRQRPVWLRQRAFAIKNHLRRRESAIPPALLRGAGSRTPPVIRRIEEFVVPARLTDSGQAHRAATLGYFFCELNC